MKRNTDPTTENHTSGQAALYELDGITWKYPSPHQVALNTVDEFLETHQFTMDELLAIRKYYRDKRTWAIRHLRLSEAARRIDSKIGQPEIILAGEVDSPCSDQGRCEPKALSASLVKIFFLLLCVACPLNFAAPTQSVFPPYNNSLMIYPTFGASYDESVLWIWESSERARNMIVP